jgi:hypothetical protein
MGSFWAAVVVWWQGKKTIVGGGLLMASAVAGVWLGKLDPVLGMGVVGAGLSIAGFSAKANRHQEELLTALQGVALAGADERAGKSALAAQDLEQGFAPLAPAAIASAGASLHISGDTAEVVTQIAQTLLRGKKAI